MPSALANFIDKYQLKGDVVLAIVTCHDFEEVLLNMAVIALKLSIELRSVYFEADFIIRQNPINSYDIERILDEDVEDPITELSEISKRVSKKITEIKDAILTNSPGVQFP